MAQTKINTRVRRASNGASGKAANSKGATKAVSSKSSHNGSGLTANELMLRAWKKIYENRTRFGKLD
ncbi:MAG: hypothetical protein H0U54_12545 [Acidobacteria bacterium]|jgi:hypothetical protein|nr:hypothetical protein [Acidobacteriota bacterium]